MFILGWTIGCSVEVKIHEYLEGTASQVKMRIFISPRRYAYKISG